MVVDSVVYFAAPNGVFAVDGVSGEQLWEYPATPAAPPPAAGEPTGRGRGNAAGGGAGTAVRGPVYWAGANSIGCGVGV